MKALSLSQNKFVYKCSVQGNLYLARYKRQLKFHLEGKFRGKIITRDRENCNLRFMKTSPADRQFDSLRSEIRLFAVPFWIVERAREPKTHSAARLERGEINEKRLGGSLSPRCLRLFALLSAISRALSTIQKGTASSLLGNYLKSHSPHSCLFKYGRLQVTILSLTAAPYLSMKT